MNKSKLENHVALVMKNEDKALFIQRSQNKKILPGAWSFPSGTQESNESIEQTATREALEELGVKIELENSTVETEIKEFGVRLIFIPCKIAEGIPIIKQPEEISEIKWMNFEEFFNKFDDSNIGHGLIWLRKNPEKLNTLIKGKNE